MSIGFRDFFSAIYGNAIGNAILVKSRRPGGAPNDQNDFRYPEQLDDMVEFCEWSTGVDLYCSPSLYGNEKSPTNADKLYRSPSNATVSHTIYSDTDTFDPTKFRVAPSIVVDTSHGRCHSWWILDEPVSTKMAAELSKRIAYAHSDLGADKSSWSENKLLRIPGSSNTKSENPKYKDKGYDKIEAVDLNDELSTFEVFTFADISNAYADVVTPDTIDYSMAIEIGEQPEIDSENIPDAKDIRSRIPVTGQDWLEMLDAEPKIGDSSNRSELRWKIIMRGHELGFTNEEIASVVWDSKAGSKWWDDSRGFDGVLYEVRRSIIAYDLKHQDRKVEDIVKDQLPETPKPKIPQNTKLLTDDQRAQIPKGNIIDRYVSVARDVAQGEINEPYYRLAAMAFASTTLANGKHIKINTGKQNISLYGVALGESTTGKSESTKFFDMMREAYLGMGGSYAMIDSKGTEDALVGDLQALGGGSATILDDEAGEVFKALNDQNSFTKKALGIYLRAYDGRIQEVATLAAKGRKRDAIDAGESMSNEVGLNIAFYTTPANLFDYISKDNFQTGLLSRFVWYVGNRRDLKRENFDLPAGDPNDIDPATGKSKSESTQTGLPRVVEQFAAEIIAAVDANDWAHYMRTSRDAQKLIADTHFNLVSKYADHPDFEMCLSSAFGRMRDSIWRLACLEALWRRRFIITLEDVYVAINEAEGWIDSLFVLTSGMAESQFSRATERVFKFISEQKDGAVAHTKIASFFSSYSPRQLRDYLTSLIEQGRIIKAEDGHARYSVVKFKEVEE